MEPAVPSSPMTPDPAPTVSSSAPALSASETGEVQIGVAPIASAAPSTAPSAIATANVSPLGVPDIIHGAKPTIFSQMAIGPTPTLLHGYSDCHLGSGVEVRCNGPVDVELLSRDQGPVTSAPSPKDIAQREPTKVKIFRQSLCHDFYVRLKASKPVKCDVAVHAVIYPD